MKGWKINFQKDSLQRHKTTYYSHEPFECHAKGTFGEHKSSKFLMTAENST